MNARDKRLRLGVLVCVGATFASRGADQEPQPYTLTVDVPQVVLTVTVTDRDGGDTASRTSFDQALHKARAVGASIYAIGVYDPRDPESSPKVLRRLARAGGGEAYFPDTASEMLPICRRIAAEIRSQYTLAFAPGDMGTEGRFHELRVKLKNRKGLDVRAREGYYEPKGGD